MIFLLGCAWFDPQNPSAERLLQAELAPPVNSGEAQEDPGILGYGWRRAAIGRWLAAHPEAAGRATELEDQLRAHTELDVAGAWQRLQEQDQQPPLLTLSLSGEPARGVIAVDRVEAVAPSRATEVAEVQRLLAERRIPSLYASVRVTHVRAGETTLSLRDLCPEPMAWLLVQQGKEPLCLPHDAPVSLMVDFSDYFGTDLVNPP
jgi:hypothetical protein